jgi:hypothetical protein
VPLWHVSQQNRASDSNHEGGNLANQNQSPGATVWQPGAAPSDDNVIDLFLQYGTANHSSSSSLHAMNSWQHAKTPRLNTQEEEYYSNYFHITICNRHVNHFITQTDTLEVTSNNPISIFSVPQMTNADTIISSQGNNLHYYQICSLRCAVVHEDNMHKMTTPYLRCVYPCAWTPWLLHSGLDTAGHQASSGYDLSSIKPFAKTPRR